MLVSDYSYDLPEERIAKFPPSERGTTRLLVLDRTTGKITDSHYRDLANYLEPGDVLVLNDTRVMQSRLQAKLPAGRMRELVVLEKHDGEPQRVMYRGKLHNNDILTINKYLIKIVRLLGNGVAEVEADLPLVELAERYGTVPLPPYLHREATANDKKRYQTVWARQMGSAAAPTASLNMTEELLDRLREKGIIIKYLTLHVGLGTFLPIRSDKIEEHKMHSEWFNIPEDTVAEIKRIKNIARCPTADEPNFHQDLVQNSSDVAASKILSGRKPKIVALGTTVARTLEYYGNTGKTSGEDDIFIYPGYKFKVVDALLTNFHAPKSTVLMLAAAFAGWEHLKCAYEHAVMTKYDFLSYGDSMLIC